MEKIIFLMLHQISTMLLSVLALYHFYKNLHLDLQKQDNYFDLLKMDFYMHLLSYNSYIFLDEL